MLPPHEYSTAPTGRVSGLSRPWTAREPFYPGRNNWPTLFLPADGRSPAHIAPIATGDCWRGKRVGSRATVFH